MANLPDKPLSYQEVLQLYERARSHPAVQGLDLRGFATKLNELSGTQLFSEGVNDSVFKRASVGIDRAIRKTGVPQVFGGGFEMLGRAISPKLEGVARPFGEEVPRSFLEGLGVSISTIPHPVAKAVGIPLAVLGTTSAFAKGYEQTGSKAAGTVSGAANVAFPLFGSFGAKYVTGPLSKRVGRDVAGKATAPILERFVDATGAAIGTSGMMELANQATSVVTGQGLRNPLTVENLFAHVAGQAAFLPLQIPGIVRGPGAGKWESHGQMLRAADRVREEAAARHVQSQKFVNTVQDSTPGTRMVTAQGQVFDDILRGKTPATAMLNPETSYLQMTDDIFGAINKASQKGAVQPNLPVPEVSKGYKVKDVRRPLDVESDLRGPQESKRQRREFTFFGEPVNPVKTEAREQIKLLTGAPTTIDLGVKPELIRAVIQGMKQGAPESLGTAVPSGKNELLIAATDILTGKSKLEGAQRVQQAGKLANEIAKQNGEVEVPVTDAKLQTKVAKLTEMVSEQEAARRVAQSVENTLNEQAGNFSLKQQRQQDAAAELAMLPEPVKNLLGEGIVAVERQRAGDQFSDIASSDLIRTALNWLKKNQLTPEVFTNSELKSKALGSLQADLGKGAFRAIGSQLKKEGGVVKRGSEQDIGGPEPEIDLDITGNRATKTDDPFAQEAIVNEEASVVSQASEVLGDILSSKPLTKEEVVGIHPKADEQFVARLNAVLQDIAQASFGDVGGRSKKGFRFVPSEGTRNVFGGAGDKTINNFVTKNLEVVREALSKRLKEAGIDFVSPIDSRGMFSNFDKKAPAPQGAFPAGVKRFFQRYFLAAGHDPAQADNYADVAQRVALIYSETDRAYIAELVDRTLGHGLMGSYLYNRSNSYVGTVAIKLGDIISGTPKEFSVFAKLWTLAHEVYHRVWRIHTDPLTADPKKMVILNNLNDKVKEMSVQDRETILNTLFKIVVPRRYHEHEAAGRLISELSRYSSLDEQEFIASYAGLLGLGAVRPSKSGASGLSEELKWMDKHFTDFSSAFYVDLTEVTGAIVELSKYGGVDETQAAQVVQEMHSTFKALASTRQEIDYAALRLAMVERGMPKSFEEAANSATSRPVAIIDSLQRLFDDLSEEIPELKSLGADFLNLAGIRNDRALEPFLGKRPNWFERNIMIPAHLRELYPTLNDVSNLVFGYRGEANKLVTRAMAPFGTQDRFGKVVFNKDAPLIKVRESKVLEEAISEVFLEQNWQKKALTFEEANKLERFAALDTEQKNTVWQAVEQTRQAMTNVANGIFKYQKLSMGDAMAHVILSKVPNMTAKRAIMLGEQLSEALFLTKSQDPNALVQAQALLQPVMTEVGPIIQQVNTIGEALYPKFLAMQERFHKQKEFYTPEVRLGRFYVRFVKDGKRHFVGKETKEESVKYVEKLQADKGVEQGSIQVADKYQTQKDVNTLYSDIVNVFTDIEKGAYEAALQSAGPEMSDVINKLYTPGEAVFREIATRGFGKHFQQRKLVPGREEINMMQGVVAYIEGMGVGLSKALTKRRAGILLSDPQMKQNKDLRNLARDYVLTVVEPPAREWSRVKGMAFHYFLGGNISSLIVEAMQPLFTLAPEMTRQGAGIAGGYKLIGEATKEAVKIATTGRSGLPPEWRVQEALKRASDEQKLDFGILQELEGIDTDTAIANLRRVSEGAETLSPAGLLTKPLYWYLHGTRTLYRTATSHNSKVAFLTGFIHSMRSGADFETAYANAVRTTESTMFGGGAAARPIGMFASSGKFHGAVGALYTLRHYTVSMLSDWYRFAKESLKSSGLTESERSQAGKALKQMVATQILMSGAMGLPLANAAVTLLEQLFPNLQLKAAIKEGLDSLAGDDEEMGNFISDVAMKGIVSATFPVDVSARFGLGDPFGLNPNKGFEPSVVFGAPGSILERWVSGVQEASQGNVSEAIKQGVPNWLGNLVKLHNDDWKVRDRAGRLIYDPTESEVLLASVGFRPKRMTQYREQQAMVERIDAIKKRELSSFHQGLAESLLKGQTTLVREALLSRQMEDETYEARAGLRSVVEYAQDRLYPVDLTRSGVRASVKEKESLVQSFPQRPQPSEVQRLTERKSFERSVGILGAGQLSRPELTKAQMIDYLLQLNPAWTRQHALIAVEQILGGMEKSIGRPSVLH